VAVFTTLALVVGFGALAFSEFVPTIYFGLLIALAMLGGLVGNLVVLPLLLALVTRDRADTAGSRRSTAAGGPVPSN
jgi:predicted RND superfamily exporter protein